MSTLDCDYLQNSQEKTSEPSKKSLVPNPTSEFLSLRCPRCTATTNAFSHSTVPIMCSSCQSMLAKPTGGKIELCDQVSINVL